MKRAIMDAAKHALNVFYPVHCASCGEIVRPINDYGVCRSCVEKIKVSPELRGKGSIRGSFSSVHSACLYEGVVKEVVHRFKYEKKPALSNICSSIMIEYASKNSGVLEGIDIITFVPLHEKRLKEREYNQSKLLACGLSRHFAVPVEETLTKIRPTKFQNELKRAERLSNLNGAFSLTRGSRLKGKRLLLVDDVVTTGSTLDECSKALLRGGAREVKCFTLARGS